MSDSLVERFARLAGTEAANPRPTLKHCRRLKGEPNLCRECPIAAGLLEPLVTEVLALPAVEREAFAARWWCHKQEWRPCAGLLARIAEVDRE